MIRIALAVLLGALVLVPAAPTAPRDSMLRGNSFHDDASSPAWAGRREARTQGARVPAAGGAYVRDRGRRLAPIQHFSGGSRLRREASSVTIAVDPGHNGRNWAHPAEINRLVDAGTLRKACDTTGTSTSSGYTEPAFTFDVALRLRRILRAAGARVVLTRTSNAGWGPCITERAAIGNRASADAAVSIHADGGPASGRGFHVIYPPSIPGLTDDIAKPSKCFALRMRAAYRSGTGLPYATYLGGRGLSVRSDLGGLNLSDVPKVFVEAGNMRNAADARLLESAAHEDGTIRAFSGETALFIEPPQLPEALH